MTDRPERAAWSYAPGDWYGIVGPSTTLLLPPGEKERVAQLWSLVDAGAGFEEVLDALLAAGLRGLPGFALVGDADGATRVLVRGAGVIATVHTGEETVDLDGGADGTWSERTVSAVESLTVTTGDAVGDRILPIEQGLVRVARVDHPELVVPGPAAAPEPMAAVAEESRVGAPEPPLHPATEPPPGPPPVQPPGAAPVAPPSPAMPPPPPPPTGAVPSAPDLPPPPEGPPTAADLPSAPDARSAPEGPPAAGDPSDPDHDGMTRAGVNREEFARPQPGIPGQPQPPSVTRPVAKLVVSNGDTVEVDRVVLIGRAPEARRFTSTEQPRLVTVPSPLHEISSTHIEVRPGAGADHGSAVVTDMGSTNGTVLVQPGLGPEELQPGIAVQLIPGAVINLGDGVTIQVTRP